LTKDQIVILTAGIVRAQIIDEKWDGKTYYLKANIAADPKEVIRSIDLLRQDRQKVKDLEEMRKKADDALREVQRLKKELALAKTDQKKIAQYDQALKKLTAQDWFAKGLTFLLERKWVEAIEAISKGIELDTKVAGAYRLRAMAYSSLEDYGQAIRDLDNGIELNPKDAAGYISRGQDYSQLGNYRQAIKDFDKAIELFENAPALVQRLLLNGAAQK